MIKWQDIAVEELRGYNTLKESIPSIRLKIEAMTAQIQAIKGSPDLSQTRVQGGKRNSDDFLVDALSEKEKLRNLLRANIIQLKSIDRVLGVLDNEENLVLEMLYISPSRGNIEYLCEELHCGRSGVYRKRDTALKKYTIYKYGYENG
jgi:hypothetical protein